MVLGCRMVHRGPVLYRRIAPCFTLIVTIELHVSNSHIARRCQQSPCHILTLGLPLVWLLSLSLAKLDLSHITKCVV